MSYRQYSFFFFIVYILLINGFLLYSQQPLQNNSQNSEKKQVFFFDFSDSDMYRIESKNTQTVYQNGALILVDNVLQNTIFITITQRLADTVSIHGNTEFFEKGIKTANYEYQYTINKQGFRVSTNGDKNISFVKDVPVFLETTIQKGDTWKGDSVEYLSIPIMNQKVPIPIKIYYSYAGYDSLPQSYFSDSKDTGIELPVFFIQYTIDDYVYPPEQQRRDASFVRINASFEIFMWWNDLYHRPEFYTEDYIMYFIYNGMQDTQNIQVEGTVTSKVFPVVSTTSTDTTVLPRIENELREALEDTVETSERTQDTTSLVQRNEKGIQVSFEDILFYPNTDIPVDSLAVMLNSIVSVLKKYAPRNLLIEGHTADVGSISTQKKLSVQRARVVKEYLQNELGWDDSYFELQGYGSEKPVASNDTKEGRGKNRRVEITILE